MEADGAYQWLMGGGGRGLAADDFDRHVAASVLALGLAEARPLTAAAGLDSIELAALLRGFFPHAAPTLLAGADGAVERPPEESCLLDLLQSCATRNTPFERALAAMIARRAQQPNHLWQDLGLRDRGELSLLMERHFTPLARRNSRNMKWKKFLYRTICLDGTYSLCTAPSCAECDDFRHCFGDEDGESRLARLRAGGAGEAAIPL